MLKELLYPSKHVEAVMNDLSMADFSVIASSANGLSISSCSSDFLPKLDSCSTGVVGSIGRVSAQVNHQSCVHSTLSAIIETPGATCLSSFKNLRVVFV